MIGEDLGTVGEGVRERLAEHGLLSSRLLSFEPTAPVEYPQPALAMISTRPSHHRRHLDGSGV